jgi:hypothetical protein
MMYGVGVFFASDWVEMNIIARKATREFTHIHGKRPDAAVRPHSVELNRRDFAVIGTIQSPSLPYLERAVLSGSTLEEFIHCWLPCLLVKAGRMEKN